MSDAPAPRDPAKTVDLPPYGPRNPDPLTDTPGSHPIETGLGAVLGGAASGLAVGLVAGPVGAIIGAIAGGALAGGLAGKGLGELLDPTTADNWLRQYHATADTATDLRAYTPDDLRPAYHQGIEAVAGGGYEGRGFDEAEGELRAGYEASPAAAGLPWADARGAVRDAYGRAAARREELLRAAKDGR